MAVALPRIVGHRGAMAVAMENTLSSFRAAYDMGTKWVEFDVMLTADGVPVLFHDETFARLIPGNAGRLDALYYAAVRELQLYGGESIPSLDETLVLLDELGMYANVEIKPSRPELAKATAVAALAIIKQRGFLGRCLVSSFAWDALSEARNRYQDLPIGILVEPDCPEDWEGVAFGLNAFSVHFAKETVTPELCTRVHAMGMKLLAYTVADASHAEALWQMGVDCVFANNPQLQPA